MRKPPPPCLATDTAFRHGFTFIEVMLSIATLALMATAIAGLYSSGVHALESDTEALLTQSMLRSQVEVLASTPFSALANGVTVVTTEAGGQTNSYTCTWVVTPVDLDGNGTVELGVKQLTVTLNGTSISLLLADHEGKVRRL